MIKDGMAKRPTRGAGDYLRLWLKGVCMGSADVVPGVSGGTMALILGIYEELIVSISRLDRNFFSLLFSRRFKEAFEYFPWMFLAAVGAGIFCAVISLARLLSWLLLNQPVLIWSFFFGLILGSLLTVGQRVRRWRPRVVVCLFLGTMGAFVLVGLVPANTPEAPWFLFLCGAVAICAMILPGISGAFVLVLMGKYAYVLDAVRRVDISTIFLVGAGAGTGLVVFSRFLGWLFRRYHDATVGLLMGLMLGSLRKIWPWKEWPAETAGVPPPAPSNVLPPAWSPEVTFAVCLALAGFFVVLLLNRSAAEAEA